MAYTRWVGCWGRSPAGGPAGFLHSYVRGVVAGRCHKQSVEELAPTIALPVGLGAERGRCGAGCGIGSGRVMGQVALAGHADSLWSDGGSSAASVVSQFAQDGSGRPRAAAGGGPLGSRPEAGVCNNRFSW